MSEKLSFQTALDYLRESKKSFPQSHLKLYSDLEPQSLGQFMATWREVETARKIQLLDALLARYAADTMVSYEEIGRALLTDPSGEVRARALHLLAESDDLRLVDSFIGILLRDAELAPRIEAADLLGEFVLLGELDKISPAAQRKIEEALVSVARGAEDSVLRRHALEALGYSSRQELAALIEAAYERSEPEWVASALRAMGRSQDEEKWGDATISKLLDDDPRVRLAAVEAAGELNLRDAASAIMQILEEADENDDLAMAAVWSLSQIGGEGARAFLVGMLENLEDENAREYLEDALENLDFNEDLTHFDLMEFDEDDDDEE